jgi:predicted transcriptional regulator
MLWSMKADSAKISTSIGLSAELRGRLDAFASQMGVTRSWLVARVLSEWLATHADCSSFGDNGVPDQ